MYKHIESFHKKPAPLSEIVLRSVPLATEYYFELLEDYGIGLNANQQEAVRTVEGPVLIVAGAGSGKTTVLTTRVGYMIQNRNIDPTNILLVTYTKKASAEMIDRLTRIPGMNRNAAKSIHAGTYHSICLKILRNEGYDFEVFGNDRARQILIKRILKEMNLQDEYSPEAILNSISGWKNSLITPDLLPPTDDVMEELIAVYKAYESYKTERNLYDFDDMLIEAYYLLKFDSAVLSKYQEQYKYILCDEFQDTSQVQYEIIQMLAEPHKNICIVGDDDQCIYSFRAARSAFMLNFAKLYPNCKQIVLDINYRSTANVIGIGNTIIQNNKVRIVKQLKSVSTERQQIMYSQPRNTDEEADQLVNDIKQKVQEGMSLSDIAVIYRTHANGRAIFDKLLEADIPFLTYSQRATSFYENTFVKPILSLLRGISQPSTHDDLINAAPIFYISKTDMKTALAQLAGNDEYIQPETFKRALKLIADKRTGFMKEGLNRKADSMFHLLKLKPAAAIMEIRKGEIDYERQLEVDGRKTLSLHKEMVIEYLDEIEQAARAHESVQGFLSFVERVIEKNAEMETLRNLPSFEAVKLMTIHTSKGLEFESVYAIGWSEGILPHASAIKSNKKDDTELTNDELLEEERRLAYVCVTRAKRHLYISSPQQHRGHKVNASRFIFEAMEKQKIKPEEELAIS